MSLYHAISSERLASFLNWTNFNKTKVLALYTLNVLISGSLYPILNMTEIALRNSINSKFIDRHDYAWFLTQSIIYPTVSPPFYIKDEISKFQSKRKIDAQHCSKFVARMPLFYWTNMFSNANIRLWNHILCNIFDSSSEKERIRIYQTLRKFQKLRNRIAHYEPIINRNLVFQYHELRRLVGKISMSAQEWCDDNCNFLYIHPKELIISKNKITPGLDLSPWIS